MENALERLGRFQSRLKQCSSRLVKVVLQRNRRVNYLGYSIVTRLSSLKMIKMPDGWNWCITTPLRQKKPALYDNHRIGLGDKKEQEADCQVQDFLNRGIIEPQTEHRVYL